MTGEGERFLVAGLEEEMLGRERALPQPGGRTPAPGELALLQSFLNTHFDLVDDWGADVLASPDDLARWLSARGLIRRSAIVGADELERTRTLREGLRELIRSRPSQALTRSLNAAVAGARLEIRFTPDGVRFVAATASELDRALAVLLSIVAVGMVSGSWSRLKVCPGDHCGWVFYDHSRNNSGRWCSMAVCGGRAKARSHYHRHRGAEA